jgi:hypothetical protein
MPLSKGFRPERPSRKAQTKKYISQPPESRTGRVDALRFCKPRFTGEIPWTATVGIEPTALGTWPKCYNIRILCDLSLTPQASHSAKRFSNIYKGQS